MREKQCRHLALFLLQDVEQLPQNPILYTINAVPLDVFYTLKPPFFYTHTHTHCNNHLISCRGLHFLAKIHCRSICLHLRLCQCREQTNHLSLITIKTKRKERETSGQPLLQPYKSSEISKQIYKLNKSNFIYIFILIIDYLKSIWEEYVTATITSYELNGLILFFNCHFRLSCRILGG